MKAPRYPLALSVIAVLLLAVAGPGTRLGLWAFPTGFKLMSWAAYAGLAAAAIALVMLLIPRIRRTGTGALVAALLMGVAVAFVPWNGMRQARSVPPIHDISTDTERPPAFVAILPLRADAANPATPAGPEVARAQATAYPDLDTRHLGVPPADAFQRALSTARSMDWEIVAADPASGRIEATATTLWFGFKDDVVIRVEPEVTGSGSQVDVRSVSRVGKSDAGTNAKRIRAYLELLGN
ncbi:DUF1499 domain-containing protein [Lysobacter sp. A286]